MPITNDEKYKYIGFEIDEDYIDSFKKRKKKDTLPTGSSN